MLFINNDDPKVFERSEDCGAGSDHNLSFSSRDPAPLIITLAIA